MPSGTIRLPVGLFYSTPVEIETYADLISYDFWKLNLPRNWKQKSDHNRPAIFDEKSMEEAGYLQEHWAQGPLCVPWVEHNKMPLGPNGLISTGVHCHHLPASRMLNALKVMQLSDFM